MTLHPTPELIAVARRANPDNGEWNIDPGQRAYGPNMDPNLRTLVNNGLVVLHPPPARYGPNRWVLTIGGQAWLATHDKEATP